MSLKLNPKLLANAMKSNPYVEDLNNRDYALERLELFGSTKWKLNCHPVPIATPIELTK